jgi:hypothetical protein
VKKSGARSDLTGLKIMGSALRAMADGNYHIQVGIFGDKNARKEGAGNTNAEIGYAHEMGSKKRGLPRRSFLWDTFQFQGKRLQDKVKTELLQLFRAGKVNQFLLRVGKAAENLVQEAFDTGGFGRWAPLKYATIISKLRSNKKRWNIFQRRQMAAEQMREGAHHAAILIETAQLRRSVTSRVRMGW